MDNQLTCQQIITAVEFIRGRNPCSNTAQSLLQPLQAIDCCIESDRLDLVPELVAIVESFPLGRDGPIADYLSDQKKRISGEERPAPSTAVKAVNLGAAMARWAAGGFQTRSQAEIDERVSICRACPVLIDDHCNLCGCACIESNQLMNKLALKTERCPIGKWE